MNLLDIFNNIMGKIAWIASKDPKDTNSNKKLIYIIPSVIIIIALLIYFI